MTYSGQSETREEKLANLALAKQNIEQAVLDSVRRQLETVELTVENDAPKYTCTRMLEQTDQYKLVMTMNEEERITEINNQPNSRIIVGAIDVIDDNRTRFTMGKTVYCLDNELVEGALLIAGNKLPHYAEVQKDDLIRASTIGKVLQIYHDRCLYFDMTNEQRTAGEFELSKAKRLQLNTNPAIVRRPPTPEKARPAARSTMRSTLTRRPSVSSQAISTPRAIMRYKVVRYI